MGYRIHYQARATVPVRQMEADAAAVGRSVSPEEERRRAKRAAKAKAEAMLCVNCDAEECILDGNHKHLKFNHCPYLEAEVERRGKCARS